MSLLKLSLFFSLLFSSVFGAYIPPSPWSTLTPTTTLSDGITDYSSTFGIAVSRITTALTSTAGLQKRAEDETKTPIISFPVITGSSEIEEDSLLNPLQQNENGHIEFVPNEDSSSAELVKRDDSTTTYYFTTPTQTTSTTTFQFKYTNSASDTPSQSESSTSTSTSTSNVIKYHACGSESTLSMTLFGSVLTDSLGRIGAIVSNRQFQFDGPPPQAGTIYALGWSISKDGYLALGDNDVFYKCLSGNFYNLYDEYIGSQCTPIHLVAVALQQC
ncbi:uncharacterized protein ASCRUDRAFT_74048 [Ascoidea rubescens DSM 1968]|uniref:Cell wall mannoprotein PIR1-like C-terminal domain-containing protein n=1 Tax=Ascoidea rubescens DSM 1968 TaxID=1344418 RepID=A0A1D2VS43_9ASCO|nr:hypothetical protein ASCRUDRAFT_74048 [Ascoidea rubescens DSM 1968]ODV64419.1 hypothetical protein ASCRUDRAFT_74048 [Ascoidea rubescens DSM 1968]